MSKYKWDLQELRMNKWLIENAYAELQDKENCNELLEVIKGYKGMLMTAKKNFSFNAFNDSYDSINLNELIDLLLGSYNIRNIPYLNAVLTSFMITNTVNGYNRRLNNYWLDATNDELVDFTHNFFEEMTTPEITKKYLHAINNTHDINIRYSKDNFNKSDYAGLTLFDKFSNKKYVSVIRSNHLIDLSVFPHEMFHYIFNTVSKGIGSDSNAYYLTEVEGAFSNILFGEYFINQTDEDNYFFKDYYRLVFMDQVNELVIRNAILDALDNKKRIRLNKLNKTLDYCNIDKFNNVEETIVYLLTPEDVIIKYSLSYLAAIDLFYMYQEDREKAFYHLENICFNKQTNSILTLLKCNGITFMDDDYQNLKKYLKK